jgi:hypothetical protein
MRKLLIFCLLPIILTGCKNEEEFDIELIPGDYIGELRYWNARGGTWSTFNNSEPSKVLSVNKIGSNYAISFDKSLINEIPGIKEIPDLTIEINPNKTAKGNSYGYVITTLPGQAFKILNKEDIYYDNQPINLFVIETPIRTVFCDLTLRSNDKDSIRFLQMNIHKNY